MRAFHHHHHHHHHAFAFLFVVLVRKGPLTDEAIEKGGYAAVLLVDETVGLQLRVNGACRRAGSAFVSASSRGAFASMFCDFGDSFVVEDQDGEEPLVRGRRIGGMGWLDGECGGEENPREGRWFCTYVMSLP